MDDTARWQAIEALFDGALDQPLEQREAYVRRHADDDALAERVLALLAAEQAAGDFMETSAQSQPLADSFADEAQPGAASRTDDRIGPWRLHELLGRGGMGEVYRAERADGQYDQTVALKLIHSDDPAQAERFEAERSILAGLNHPNIARLIDGGLTDDRRPYMAMEYVDGRSLARYLREEQPDLTTRLQLFLQLCAAVAHAHAHLVVHRDIKPDNVQIDATGAPRLLDFGIAKLTRPGIDAEQTQALATPNYAAPEQFTGGAVTTSTDVYGLGATLYFMLCERPPLDLEGASLPQLLDRLRHTKPEPPSRGAATPLRTHLSEDLDAICAQAMQKEPDHRYASVQQLAEDVQRYLQHEPIQARPPALSHRIGLYVRRHRLTVAAGLAVTLSLILGLAIASWQAHVAAVQRDQARRDAARLTTMQSTIMQLFRSASSADEELTARELFARSAQQIETDFHDDPATATPLMQMLGELLLAYEDFATAENLLRRAEANYTPELGESLLANISIDLAHIAYRDGELDEAQRQYSRAARIWDQQPTRYRSERIWSATLASQLARAKGEPARAVTILSEAANAAYAQWGEAHEDTGIVLINLAVAHYYNNQLAKALQACANAWQVWQAMDRTDSPDALNLLGNWGLFAMRYGDPITGEQRLAEAMELRSAIYGPSAALATLMKNLGIAHRVNGRKNAGMRLLEQGEWMAKKYAGEGSRLHASAVFALARALIEDQLPDEAEQLLRDAQTAGAGKHSPWHHLNRVLLARLLTAPEQQGEAQALFEQGLQALRALGDSGLSQYADALMYQSRWQQARGQTALAADTLGQAIAAKTRARRPGHFEALLMHGEHARLAAELGQTDAASQELTTARTLAAEQFGAEHPVQRQLADLHL